MVLRSAARRAAACSSLRATLRTTLLTATALLAGAAAPCPAQDAEVPAGTERFRVAGTSAVVEIRADDAGARRALLSRDGGRSFGELLAPQTRLMLRSGAFDPLADGEPPVPVELRARPDGRLFIVQLETQIVDEYRRAIGDRGAEIARYLPHQGFVVRMPPGAAEVLRELPFVRFVGALHPAYKLEPGLLAALDAGPRDCNVMMVDDRVDRAPLCAAIEAAGGKVAAGRRGAGVLVTATLSRAQLLRVAAEDTVLWIDRTTEAEVDVDIARIQGGANYLEAVAGIDGKGLTGMVMEGVHATHPEFAAIPPYRAAPIVIGDGTPSEHGTNTAGIVYAQGVRPDARGIAPFAQMAYCSYLYVLNNSLRKQVTGTLIQNHRGMFETASWGYARTAQYTSRSAEMDDIIFDLDILITQANGNGGGSRPQAWAKNIVTVGGFYHYGTPSNLDDQWLGGASIGPAADGRIKPDLSAYYDWILTTSGTSGYTSTFGGTSGSTPIVNGYAGLAIQMFAEGTFGYPAAASWQNLFDQRPHFTTGKALLINTAQQAPFSGLAHDMTRLHQGWGMPNVQVMYDLRNRMLVVDETELLSELGARDYLVFVPPGSGDELRATMVHADPEASPAAAIHRVNSLDLRVTDPAGIVYWGNHGLLENMYSTPGGSANDRDTVENVWIAQPAPGAWRVHVTAAALRLDGHPATPAVDTAFALVVSGIGGGRDRTHAQLDLRTAPGRLRLDLGNLPSAWTEGFTLFSTDTRRVPGIGNLFGLEVDSLTIAGLEQPAAAGNPFHFTRTTAPLYPNVTFDFPAPLAAILTGVTLDAVALLIDSNGALVSVSNVDRVTVQ